MIEEWVQECREGKTRTYTEIVRALRPGLLAFLYRMTHDAEVAEELGQEAFLKAFQKLHQFDSTKSSFSTWLFTIARNQCVDYIRKQKIHWLSDGQTDGLVSLHPVPRDSAFESEMGRLIAKAVCGLEVPYREVFILKEYHQYNVEEIARITNTSSGTVKSRLFRARHALQDVLSPMLKQAGKHYG